MEKRKVEGKQINMVCNAVQGEQGLAKLLYQFNKERNPIKFLYIKRKGWPWQIITQNYSEIDTRSIDGKTLDVETEKADEEEGDE